MFLPTDGRAVIHQPHGTILAHATTVDHAIEYNGPPMQICSCKRKVQIEGEGERKVLSIPPKMITNYSMFARTGFCENTDQNWCVASPAPRIYPSDGSGTGKIEGLNKTPAHHKTCCSPSAHHPSCYPQSVALSPRSEPWWVGCSQHQKIE